MDNSQKIILAFVGMPGAGKSEAAVYLKQKGIPFVRFGDATDEAVKGLGLTLTPQNERIVREKLRKEHGMSAYAVSAEPKITKLLENERVIAIDGLRSWEEYTYLKTKFPGLYLVHIYAQPLKRYLRLAKRPIRPVPSEEARNRDILELENLNMGGPIAVADHLIENNEDSLKPLYSRIDALLQSLGIIS